MTGWWPASLRRLTVCDPMYPAPPATSTFIPHLLRFASPKGRGVYGKRRQTDTDETGLLFRGPALQTCPCAHPVVLERDAEMRAEQCGQEGRLRAVLGLAGVAVDGGFHRLELLVPDVAPAAGVDEAHLPHPLVHPPRAAVGA